MSDSLTPQSQIGLIADVARLEEKINALTDKMSENTEITQANLLLFQEVKTSLKVLETKILYLQKADHEHTAIHDEEKKDKKEWYRRGVFALLAFVFGLIAKKIFGV